MLNLSKIDISDRLDKNNFSSFKYIKKYQRSSKLLKVSFVFFAIVFVVSFFPWTQNISAESYVTTLEPDKRPQNINSIIAGKIEKWYVKEGSFVKKGDTIIFLTEVKDKYFDPELLDRTKEQVDYKEQTVDALDQKVKAIDEQIEALVKLQNYKIEQAKIQLKQAQFKIASDSARLVGTQENLIIAKQQYQRAEELYQKKLNTINQLEQRKFALQDEQAKFIEHQNNLLSSENEKLNAEIQIITLVNEFQEKLAKLNSNKQSALSFKFGEDANLSILENTYSNYKQRGIYHYILAPQDGYITRINKAGIGEVFKEGESIVTIMPINYNLAIEMYVRPIDIPLIKKGGKVRVNFDGWPSFIISGWPIISFGTYGGEIIAIDRYISNNGLYRIMVAPDPNDEQWPKNVKVGTGAESVVLFNDVPTWYEFWRQLNGFPPNYYKGNPDKNFIKISTN
ncbi:MAG: hypothetical protein RLZZ414_2211 [Bacteroidota bacterium]|jgi:multidrug efflux pump subunit AcrA (membrane-fusion protein)